MSEKFFSISTLLSLILNGDLPDVIRRAFVMRTRQGIGVQAETHNFVSNRYRGPLFRARSLS